MAARISAKRARQLSRNPATRTRVPTSQLSAKHRKMREQARAAKRRKAELDDPNAVTRPLTPRLLEEQVQQQTNLWAAPAEQQLKGQMAVSGAMMQAIPQWYNEFLAARQQAVQQTAGAYAGAIGVQQQAAATSGALDAQQRAAMMQQMQADAAQRGAVVDPSIAATGQQAAAARQATLAAQQGLTAGLGAADVGYRANQVAVGAGQKVQALETEARRGRGIMAQERDLATQKGQYAAKTRRELIDREHTKQLENKAFGLNVAKAQQDAAHDAASLEQREETARHRQSVDRERLRNERARVEISRGQLEISRRRVNAYEAREVARGGKKMDATTKTRTIKQRDEIELAKRRIAQLRKAKLPVKVKDANGKWVEKRDKNGNIVTKPANLTWGQIREALETGKGGKAVSHDAVNSALDLIEKGYLSVANVRALQRRGVRVGALGYTTEHGRSRRARRVGGGSTAAARRREMNRGR